MSKTCKNIREAQSFFKFFKVHDHVTTMLTLPNNDGNHVSEDTIEPPLLNTWIPVRV